MNEKLKELHQIINSEPYTPKKQQQMVKIYCVCLLSIIFLFLIAVVLEILIADYKLIPYTIAFLLFFLFVYFITKKYNVISFSKILMGLGFTFCYSITFWRGTGLGCGSTWLILVPAIAMYLLGFKTGLIISIYFWIFSGVCCFVPPVRNLMHFQYSKNYLVILFIAYTVELIFSFITMLAYYKNQIKQKALEEKLEQAVLKERNRITNITLKTILAISNSVEAKDEYTSEHSHRVADFSCMIAKKLEWTEDQIEQLRNIALLHDIGKISVSEAVLNKPGKLTDEEFNQIKKHTVVGGEILSGLTLIPNVALGAKFHHERYDSRGYPSGLEGEQIPIEARIICIADSFDAMRYKRIYRGECDPEYILSELKKGRGTQFDPDLLDIFLQVVEEEKLL